MGLSDATTTSRLSVLYFSHTSSRLKLIQTESEGLCAARAERDTFVTTGRSTCLSRHTRDGVPVAARRTTVSRPFFVRWHSPRTLNIVTACPGIHIKRCCGHRAMGHSVLFHLCPFEKEGYYCGILMLPPLLGKPIYALVFSHVIIGSFFIVMNTFLTFGTGRY
jgi:hypothetical protein